MGAAQLRQAAKAACRVMPGYLLSRFVWAFVFCCPAIGSLDRWLTDAISRKESEMEAL